MNKLFLYILIILLSSCSISPYTISSDYDTAGKFEAYSTFKILTNTQMDQTSRKVLERAIDNRMIAMGYFHTDNPSFYINYQIVEGDFKIKTFMQPNLQYYLSTKDYEKHEQSESSFTEVSGEMLMISIFDPTINKVIWRGQTAHKSGSKSYRELIHKVNAILDNYIIARNIKSRPVASF